MKIKRYLLSIVIALPVAASSGMMSVLASEAPIETATGITANNTVPIVSYAEETEWYFRYVDGKLQKRLWSLTYAKWLTEWEWVV